MIDIFGPETPRLLRLMSEISDLNADDVDAVARAWRGTSLEERAAAWSMIQTMASPEERIAIQHAALLARHRALNVSQQSGRRDWAFWSAAWDAAGAVAADGGLGDEWSYEVLVSALASKLPWLSQRGSATEIPRQRGSVQRGVSDESASYSGSGGRR